MIKHDIKRIILSPSFYVAIFLFVIVGILQQAENVVGQNRMLASLGVDNFGFFNRYIYSTCHGAQMHFMLPVIAAIPCANLYLQEYKSKYMRNILVRTSRIKYFLSKIIVSFLCGVFVVLIGEIILFSICFLVDSNASVQLIDTQMMSKTNFIRVLYENNIPLFALFESGNLMLFGGVYSLFTLSFSAVWNNKYLAYSTGFLFANIVIDELTRYIKTPYVTYCVSIWYLETMQNTYIDVLLQYGAITLISIIVFAIFFFTRSKTDV